MACTAALATLLLWTVPVASLRADLGGMDERVLAGTPPPVPQKEEEFKIERLPIEFLVDDTAKPLLDGESFWFCVKIRLLPEDGGDKYAVLAKRRGANGRQKRRYRMTFTPEERGGDVLAMDHPSAYMVDVSGAASSEPKPGLYRDTHAKDFILGKHASEDKLCQKKGGVYMRFADLQAFVHERMTVESEGAGQESPPPDAPRDALEAQIDEWNKAWARPTRDEQHKNGCSTTTECSGYHVSYLKAPEQVQRRIVERLEANFNTFFNVNGAGIAGTTGAHFVAGNRGYRFPDYGSDMLQRIFTEEDRKEYEDEIRRVVSARKDMQEMFKDGMDFDFQHRLWRYGPDFGVKGGVWHRDTCPFGIGGGVPEGGLQMTVVYVPWAENLDLSQSGTRLKDRFKKTHEMLCIPGTANIMRSGENDPYAPWHAGPILRKLNSSRPAYRVMMQSKMVLRPAERPPPPAGKERWGALGIPALEPTPAREQKEVLAAWFGELSQALAWGASESNAVGSEAYPINATRAWSRTEELASFLGFEGGFLPHFAPPPDDVQDENAGEGTSTQQDEQAVEQGAPMPDLA